MLKKLENAFIYVITLQVKRGSVERGGRAISVNVRHIMSGNETMSISQIRNLPDKSNGLIFFRLLENYCSFKE
jgi:hypothetical protein